MSLKQNYKSKKIKFSESEVSNRQSKIYSSGPPEFTIEIYENLGKQILISILDIFGKNPISRIPHTKYENLAAIRTSIASHITKYERFGKITNIKTQIANINSYIDQVFYKKLKLKIFS